MEHKHIQANKLERESEDESDTEEEPEQQHFTGTFTKLMSGRHAPSLICVRGRYIKPLWGWRAAGLAPHCYLTSHSASVHIVQLLSCMSDFLVYAVNEDVMML